MLASDAISVSRQPHGTRARYSTMPKIALAKKKPITGIRNNCIGRLKYCGYATMPAVQNSAIRVKIRCSASANQLNQPVRKWKRWPAENGQIGRASGRERGGQYG